MNGKTSNIHGLEDNIKMKILSKLICILYAISVKISAFFIFAKIDKLILIFMWNWKRPRINKTTLKMKTMLENSCFMSLKLTAKLYSQR